MIMVRSVIVFLLLSEICRFADEIFAAAGVKRRDAALRKFKNDPRDESRLFPADYSGS